YRELGPATGVPVIFLHHLGAVLDNWDPRAVDGIAAKRHVFTFDNRGVGASGGKTPKTIEEMARDAVAFIRALGFDQVDLYRELGPATGVPVIFLHHLGAVLDNWDPRAVDGIAAKRHVFTFDNRGVGASGGKTPKTIEEMARDAVAFIRALGFDQVDLFG